MKRIKHRSDVGGSCCSEMYSRLRSVTINKKCKLVSTVLVVYGLHTICDVVSTVSFLFCCLYTICDLVSTVHFSAACMLCDLVNTVHFSVACILSVIW